MQKWINYGLYAVGMILFLVFLFFPHQGLKEYHKNIFYMDTYIDVTLYSKDEKKAQNALEEVTKIYQHYHNLSDPYGSYPEINVYYINHNTDPALELTIPVDLYKLLEFGVSWYEKSNHLLNINLGGPIEVWKKYREKETGVPSLEELKNSGSTNISEIVLLGNNKIKNTHPNINLGSIAKGYATQKVSDYLKNIGITQFLINAGGNVVTGDYYSKGNYKIGVEDPTDPSSLYQVIRGKNVSVVTSGSYQRYYHYEGVRYHHLIDPSTLFPTNYMESVTVVTKDSALADALSTTLFLMNIEDGKKFLKNFPNAEAIWYQTDGTITKSEGFAKYE